MTTEANDARKIQLAGQDNFRDLGGYASADGRRVRWRQLYRSGELTDLTDEDVVALAGLELRTVVDLRGEAEAGRKGPDRLPVGTTLMALAIEPGNLLPHLTPAFVSGDFSTIPHDLLLQINRDYVRSWRAQLGRLLRIAADPEHRPLVFHCTHGKDRAGIGAAVLLSALGVPWETVMEDYLASNVHRGPQAQAGLLHMRASAARKRRVEPEAVDMTHVRGLFFVDASYLGAAHDEIVARFGSMEAFLTEGIGWSESELHRLRDALLE